MFYHHKPKAKDGERTATRAFEMEVFKAGDYGEKGCWSEADLDRLVADYDPKVLEAPLTIDHAHSGPAYGWVERLWRNGDRLLARVTDVPEALADMIREGGYRQRSVELMKSFKETGGRPYLRAVSLLGAAIPEVKGLRPISFGAAAEGEVACFDAGGDADTELAVLRARIRDLRRALLRSELAQGGVRLGPAQEARFFETVEALPDELTFMSESGEAVGAGRWLAALLCDAAAAVPKAPAPLPAPPLGDAAPDPEAAEFSAALPEDTACGGPVDAESVRLQREALAIMRAEASSDFAQALRKAAGRREGKKQIFRKGETV